MSMIDKFKMGRARYSLAKLWAYLATQETALAGDLVIVATPAALGSSAAAVNAAIGGAAAKFTRQVRIELQNAAGDIHTWFNGSLAIAVAEITAGDGISAIAGGVSTVEFVEGVGTITIEYTGTWAAADTQTLTITGGTILGYAVTDKTSVDTLIA